MRRKEDGHSFTEFLITLAIIGIFAVIAIPSLSVAKNTAKVNLFDEVFGIRLELKWNEALTEQEKNILRPVVLKYIDKLNTEDLAELSPATDPAEAQVRYDRLRQNKKAIERARSLAKYFGILEPTNE